MWASLINKSRGNFEIEWNKSAPFFGEKLFQAIEYLAFRARNRNSIAACETVEKIVAEQNKYQLYKKFFPDEWNRSRASFFKTDYYDDYSERTNEFFQLVHKKLFPVLAGWNDDPEADLENFYIFSLNIDLCCEDIEYENLRISYVFALIFYFRDDELWEFLASHYEIYRDDFPAVNDHPHDDLWQAGGNELISLYVNLFEIIDHSTCNPWLDTVSCRGGYCFIWDEDTVITLTESYKEAQLMLERTVLLDEMIEADPKKILLDLISLWNDGRLPEKEKKRRVKREKIRSLTATR